MRQFIVVISSKNDDPPLGNNSFIYAESPAQAVLYVLGKIINSIPTENEKREKILQESLKRVTEKTRMKEADPTIGENAVLAILQSTFYVINKMIIHVIEIKEDQEYEVCLPVDRDKLN